MNPRALSLLLGPVVALQAYAEVYLSETQATEALFPGMKFEKKSIHLDDADVGAIEKASGQSVRARDLTIWKTAKGECVYVDQVLGKHEFITYAVGIDAAGKVKGVEILEYRESYGQQVRKPEWREQFVGKDKNSTLKVNTDIKNLSGATLSSSHITDGVRRLLQTHERVRARVLGS